MRHSEKNIGFGVTDFRSGPTALGGSLAPVSSPIIPWALIRGCTEDALHHTQRRDNITVAAAPAFISPSGPCKVELGLRMRI